MARLGFVSHRTAARLSALPVRTASQQRPPIPAQYFLSYVRKGLEHEFGTRRTFEGGLRVRTSLDLRLQREARIAVDSHLRTKGDPSAALVAIDPSTGQVLAMVGGRNQRKVKFNLATQARRQAGSAFKLYTLAAASEIRDNPDPYWNQTRRRISDLPFVGPRLKRQSRQQSSAPGRCRRKSLNDCRT